MYPRNLLKNMSLFIMGAGFSIASLNASAVPVYLLLEGTVTGGAYACSGCYNSGTFPISGGSKISITASWDDALMFGGDADANPEKGTYGSTGYIWSNSTDYYLANGDYLSNSSYYGSQSPTYTLSINGYPKVYNLGSQMGGSKPWSWQIALATDHSNTADVIALSVKSDTGYPYGGGSSFSLNLSDVGHSSLDQQLFGFNWDASKGGSASGQHYSYTSHIVSESTSYDISWSRAVLSRNAADVASVPLPASAELLAFGFLTLLRGRRLRKLN